MSRRIIFVPPTEEQHKLFLYFLFIGLLIGIITIILGRTTPNVIQDLGYATNFELFISILFMISGICLAIACFLVPLLVDIAFLSLFIWLIAAGIFAGSVVFFKPSWGETNDRLTIQAFKAVASDNIEVLNEILNNKPDIIDVAGYKDNTLLHQAAARNKINIVKLLLDKDANINLLNSDQKTALDLAKDYNNTENIVELLEKRGHP